MNEFICALAMNIAPLQEPNQYYLYYLGPRDLPEMDKTKGKFGKLRHTAGYIVADEHNGGYYKIFTYWRDRGRTRREKIQHTDKNMLKIRNRMYQIGRPIIVVKFHDDDFTIPVNITADDPIHLRACYRHSDNLRRWIASHDINIDRKGMVDKFDDLSED